MKLRTIAITLALLLSSSLTLADALPGTLTVNTGYSFEVLKQRLQQAIADNQMGLVTQASASAGAANRGVKIPGNAVFGVYRNDFAVRMLAASVAAGIEAPIRYYITENPDGSASLTYRKPSAVFAPYDSRELNVMAAELDAIFARIAQQASQ